VVFCKVPQAIGGRNPPFLNAKHKIMDTQYELMQIWDRIEENARKKQILNASVEYTYEHERESIKYYDYKGRGVIFTKVYACEPEEVKDSPSLIAPDGYMYLYGHIWSEGPRMTVHEFEETLAI